MASKKLLIIYGIILLVIALPFVIIHLAANPDDADITPVQHIVAALANFFGPWGVVIVRVVDFPNAGWRAFSWTKAGVLTLLGGLLIWLPLYWKKRYVQYLCITAWFMFVVVWLVVGLRQIAHGLL